MHIEKFKHYSKYYLRLVQSKRMVTKNGKSIPGKKLILSLGALEKFDDGKPDYLERLRDSFRRGNPLIEELRPYVDKAPVEKTTIVFTHGDASCFGEPKKMAPMILDPVFDALGLNQLFASIKFQSKIKFDLLGIVRLLVYGRLLNPSSKCATMKQNNDYFRPMVKSSNNDNVYDALAIIYANAKQIIQRMNTMISRGTNRTTDTVFYDVTNFFFEIEHSDDDMLDEDGNVIEKGTRKYGVSKENRKQPIVQLGLFMDNNGIPISFGMFPGNTLDHHTFRPAMKETIGNLELSRFILIADRGMYSGTNMCHVLDAGNGYIVSKSLRKSSEPEIEWALNPAGYTCSSPDFRCKSRIVNRTVYDENGNQRTIQEKVVVYWSKSFYQREYHEHKSFLEFIEKLKANPAGFRITSSQSKSLKRFLKKEVKDKQSGEILDGSKLVAMIDDGKLNQFNELMGYYQIVSSELTMSDEEIIAKYHGLTQIEDQFREMKSTLETRPIYVRTKEHIHAHLMICFIALTMMRLIQCKIKTVMPSAKDQCWNYGLPGARLVKALSDFQVNTLPGEYYQLLNVTGDDIRTIFKAYNLSFESKIYTKGDLRDMKSQLDVF